MAIILFDDDARQTLLPLTFTRPVASLRIGILTVAEKWAKHLGVDYSYHTQPYLQGKFPFRAAHDNLLINGSVCPDERLAEAVQRLRHGQALRQGDTLLAARLDGTMLAGFNVYGEFKHNIAYSHPFTGLRHPDDIFTLNDGELKRDFNLLTRGRRSAVISNTNVILGEQFFAEEGAVAECSTFNTTQGPVYLAENTEVWEGSHIRGSFALCESSQVKMGAKIYGGTTIGPHCRVGGEIKNAVIWGNSAKGHEGYLGNSVIGEWCNIAADSNNSNLKNNYSEVKLWSYALGRFRKTGLQFCGLIMADHAKCGINTMFNTGTVVGVGANVFGAGYLQNFVPDFSWGGAQHTEVYAFNKMIETTGRVYERRDIVLNDTEKQVLKHIFDLTEQYRKNYIL